MDFNNRAKNWDKLDRRVKNAKSIADRILENIDIKKGATIADIGAGTGLLSQFLDKKVSKIVAIDNSKEMLNEFLKKSWSCRAEVLNLDLEKDTIDIKVDGFISSMTLHHIQDIESLFRKLYQSLNSGGFIAIADLDLEDGSFHTDNSGVYHYGFEFNRLLKLAEDIGFIDLDIKSCGFIKKDRDFEVKLLIAFKP